MSKKVNVTIYPMNDQNNQLIVVLIAGLLSAALVVGGITAIFQGQFQAGAISIIVGGAIGFWLYKRISND